MSAATSMVMAAAMASQPYDFVSGAMVGDVVPEPGQSQLSGLLVSGEHAILAAEGDGGCVLFTSTRVLIGEQAGIMSKRLAVKSLRRDSIIAYAIDPSTHVSVELIGAFGKATLHFAEGFNPMLLSEWLGSTLTGSPIGGEN